MPRTWTAPATLGLVAATAVLAAGLATVGAQQAEAASTPRADLFYVQNADGARLIPRGGRRYDLHLSGVGAQATWFADRPDRDTGQISTRALVARWDRGESFRRTPPNAALEGLVPGSRRPASVVLELKQATRTANGVRYRALLERRPSGDLSHYRGRNRTQRGPLRLRSASLLIDSDPQPLVNGCVIAPFTNCAGFQFPGAVLQNAQLHHANLRNAFLAAAVLTRADLTDAALNGANLRFANLTNADLTGATGVDLTDAVVCNTTTKGSGPGGALPHEHGGFALFKRFAA